jgi:hypothetical protein
VAVSILQDTFELGVRQDRSKDRIGANAVWDLIDYVPYRKGAPLTRRGGWEQKGTFSGGTPGYIRSGIMAPFNGGRYLLAVNSSGVVYRTAWDGSTWAIDGTTRNVGTLKQKPHFYFDDLFFPSPDGTQTMSRSNEVQVTEYTYTATYKPTYLTSWKNRLIGAVGENIVFGPPGDPNQAWDDAALYVQTQPIKGLATVRTACLIFYQGHIDIMRGSIPAGYDVVDDDIRFDSLFSNYGLVDAFSITYWNDLVFWADRAGIYFTDGAAATDLSDQAGIKQLWIETLLPYNAQFEAGTMRVTAGVYQDLLHISVVRLDTHAHVATFVIDLARKVAWRYENTPFTCYFENPFDPHELYASAEINGGKVAELSHTILTDNPTDEDGANTPVEPVVEFGYFRFAHNYMRLVDLYLGYEIEDNVGSPELVVSYTSDPNPNTPTYANYSDGDETLYPEDLHGTTDEGYHWHRIPVRLEGAGLGVKVIQNNASDATRIYALGATVIQREGWEQG